MDSAATTEGQRQYFAEPITRYGLTPFPPNPSKQDVQRPRKLSWKESRELERMEKRISDAESEIARIEALFMSPDFHQQHGPRAGSLMDNLTAAKEELAQLYKRWEELETLAATTKK